MHGTRVEPFEAQEMSHKCSLRGKRVLGQRIPGKPMRWLFRGDVGEAK
jgi:hypothetical protein